MRLIIYSTGKEAEFKRQAEAARNAWKHQHEVLTVPIDVRKPAAHRRRQLIEAVGKCSMYTPLIAFFCHGTKRGTELGWNTDNVAELVTHLPIIPSIEHTIALFCCWCGVPGGFADALAATSGTVVLAHTTRGHTTGNPNKIVTTYDGHRYPAYQITREDKAAFARRIRGARTDDSELELLEKIHNANVSGRIYRMGVAP
jgi:hypothetical protein